MTWKRPDKFIYHVYDSAGSHKQFDRLDDAKSYAQREEDRTGLRGLRPVHVTKPGDNEVDHTYSRHVRDRGWEKHYTYRGAKI